MSFRLTNLKLNRNETKWMSQLYSHPYHLRPYTIDNDPSTLAEEDLCWIKQNNQKRFYNEISFKVNLPTEGDVMTNRT